MQNAYGIQPFSSLWYSSNMERRHTTQVRIRDTHIGSDYPISIQTMWDKPVTQDSEIDDILRSIRQLHEIGCDIIRFSVPSLDDIQWFRAICERSCMPIVADIHFDHKIALAAIQAGADKIRINPGNIGADWKVRDVIQSAKDHGKAIRIGINGGSLNILDPSDSAEKRAEKALGVLEKQLELFIAKDFTNLVVALKDSDPMTTLIMNRTFASTYDHPIHLGLTEAGPLIPSIARSSYTLGTLLAEGIGDTLRISITDSLDKEVRAAKEILRTVDRYHQGVRIISCPTCGRTDFDTRSFLAEMQPYFDTIRVPLTIAVMGCVVNGPGEAKHADLGITGIGRKVFLFKAGAIIRETDSASCVADFKRELEDIIQTNEKTDH